MNMPETTRIPVLLYHRVDYEKDRAIRPFCVNPDNFELQMSWLKKEGYQTISLDDLKKYYIHGESLPEHSIVITFDDGFFCNYTRVFPILRDLNFIAVIFLALNLINDKYSTVESKDSFLSWDEIKEMTQSGFSFQSHGCSHRPMDSLSIEEVSREARESKLCIEKHLNKKVNYFCYPFSKYNAQIKRIVEETGYLGACGGPPFWEGGPKDWFEIGRTEILGSDSFTQFQFKIKHGLSYYYFTKRQLGKVKRKFYYYPGKMK